MGLSSLDSLKRLSPKPLCVCVSVCLSVCVSVCLCLSAQVILMHSVENN